jgi:acyl-CoA reductase-like NAD-dependent aldehyde dehydrogenase
MSRLLVHDTVYDEVTEKVVAMTQNLTIGPGIDDNFITPLISSKQLDRVENCCLLAAQQGKKPITGGRRFDRPGYFMEPTIFADVKFDMAIAREEVFGPVLSIIRFGSDREAINIANSTDYGLVAGVFTADLDRATFMSDRLQAGQVFVNEWFAGGVETPFGGMKKSGFGREKGQDALANYYQSKNVAIRRLSRPVMK